MPPRRKNPAGPRSAAKPKTTNTRWTCAMCTFENPRARKRCQMCTTVRSAEGPAAPEPEPEPEPAAADKPEAAEATEAAAAAETAPTEEPAAAAEAPEPAPAPEPAKKRKKRAPKPPEAPAAGDQSWTCGACTFVNARGRKCGVCGTSRAAAAAGTREARYAKRSSRDGDDAVPPPAPAVRRSSVASKDALRAAMTGTLTARSLALGGSREAVTALAGCAYSGTKALVAVGRGARLDVSRLSASRESGDDRLEGAELHRCASPGGAVVAVAVAARRKGGPVVAAVCRGDGEGAEHLLAVFDLELSSAPTLFARPSAGADARHRVAVAPGPRRGAWDALWAEDAGGAIVASRHGPRDAVLQLPVPGAFARARGVAAGRAPRSGWSVVLADRADATTAAVVFDAAATLVFVVDAPARSVFCGRSPFHDAAAAAAERHGADALACLAACGDGGLAQAVLATTGDACRVCVGATRGSEGAAAAAPGDVAAGGRFVVEARGAHALKLHDLAGARSMDVRHDLGGDFRFLAVCDAGDRGALVASVHDAAPANVRFLPCPFPEAGGS